MYRDDETIRSREETIRNREISMKRGDGRRQMTRAESPSIPELIRELAVDIKDLGVSEMTIAKLEFKEEIDKLKSALAVAAGSGVIALVGLIVLAFAAARGLDVWFGIDPGIGMLIVAVILLALAAIGFFAFRSKAEELEVVPHEAAEGAGKDARWLKQRLKSAAR